MNNTKPFTKQNFLFLTLAILNLAVCLFLTLTCVPGQIPLRFDFNEKISSLGSKWWLSINMALPLILAILMFVFHKKEYVSFMLKALFIFMLYENLLLYSYFSLATNLEIGTLSEVPLAASTFLPASALIAVFAIKIKHIPYKSKLMGIRTKYTKADEFIWKQTHFYARDVFFATGVLLFFANIPFLFVRFIYVPLALLLVAIIVSIILINRQSKLMYEKLVDMKARQERMNSKKKTESDTEKTETNPEEKTEEKSQKNQNKTTKK